MIIEVPEWVSHCGDALECLSHLPDDSVDAIITDPPSGIGVMGYDWDKDKGGRDAWISWLTSIFIEAKRVLRAGGFAVVWALPKTSHWTATAVEDAGFQIHEVIHHIFGNGLPKVKGVRATQEEVEQIKALGRSLEGKGTQLKPSAEHWIIARKPLDVSSVAKEIIKFGTGAMNIDQCRIGSGSEANGGRHPANVVLCHSAGCKPSKEHVAATGMIGIETDWDCVEGCPVAMMDAMSGISGGSKSNGNGVTKSSGGRTGGYHGGWTKNTLVTYSDSGGASRFFAQFVWTPDMDELIFRYINKPSRAERHAGTDELEAGVEDVTWRDDINDVKRAEISRILSETHEVEPYETDPITIYKLENIPVAYVVFFKPVTEEGEQGALRNTHPTVKPVALVRYFVRLFVPPGGRVLDFFGGSGTTGVASILEGRDVILIELEAHNVEIINARCKHAVETYGTVEQPVIVRRTARKRRDPGTISMEDLWSTDDTDEEPDDDTLDVDGDTGHGGRGTIDTDSLPPPRDESNRDSTGDNVMRSDTDGIAQTTRGGQATLCDTDAVGGRGLLDLFWDQSDASPAVRSDVATVVHGTTATISSESIRTSGSNGNESAQPSDERDTELDREYDEVVERGIRGFIDKAVDSIDGEDDCETVCDAEPSADDVDATKSIPITTTEEEQAKPMDEQEEPDANAWKTKPLPKREEVAMTTVSSSNIVAVGYDEASRTLLITYKGNRTYWYKGVAKARYDDILYLNKTGGSIGTFVDQKIRLKYDFGQY